MAGKPGNPYHDAKGLFSTAAGDADGKASGGRSADEVTQRAANNGLTNAEYKAKYGMTPAEFKAKLAKSAKVGPARGKDYHNDVFGQVRATKALHTVHVQYDDPKGGRASIRVPVSARTRDGAVKKAMERLSRFPHPISGYKNANVLRVTKK